MEKFRSSLWIIGVAFACGLFIVARQSPKRVPADPEITARQVQILRDDGTIAIQLAIGDGGAPGLWLHPGAHAPGTVQLGLRDEGYPAVLVSDAAINNFGLGRVDGPNRSPLLIFRHHDEVRMVFGLSMTDAGMPAFLTYFSADGTKHDFLGHYCDTPSRVCVSRSR